MRKAVIGIAAMSVLTLAACGDDNASSGLPGSNGTTTLPAEGAPTTTAPTSGNPTATTAPQSGSTEMDGYTEDERIAFVDACTASAGAGAESACECMWTQVTQTLPYDDFVAYEEAVREDPQAAANPPQELTDAAASCTQG